MTADHIWQDYKYLSDHNGLIECFISPTVSCDIGLQFGSWEHKPGAPIVLQDNFDPHTSKAWITRHVSHANTMSSDMKTSHILMLFHKLQRN